jgi:8-oxo-dGTP pyrophosphatase MutT (NUDIX family)
MTWTTLSGAGGIVVRDGRLLMIRQRRPYGVHWEFPSGHYEPGESFEQTTLHAEVFVNADGTQSYVSAASPIISSFAERSA